MPSQEPRYERSTDCLADNRGILGVCPTDMCHNRANPGDDYVLRKSCVRTYWWLHDCRIAKIPADATPATELAGTIAIEGTVIAETERIVEAATAAAIALNDLAELNQPQ